MPPAKKRYRIVKQPVYYDGKTAEVGDVVNDLPVGPNIAKLLAAGIIEEVTGRKEAD